MDCRKMLSLSDTAAAVDLLLVLVQFLLFSVVLGLVLTALNTVVQSSEE